MSTQADESQILSLTSVTKTNNSSSMTEKCRASSIPTSVGASGVAAQQSAASISTNLVAAKTRIEQREIQRGNKKLRSDRVPKRANDAVALHNRFGALEDIDFAPSPFSTRICSISPRK